MSRKRLPTSESNPDSTDSLYWNKRITSGSPFDNHRAEPSQQPVVPPLDAQRAELSRRHVRALNTQFASWVQTQLKNHPDELWEDGARDYISHASSILEKFSDVVTWIKANSLKGETLSAPGTNNTDKKIPPEIKEDFTKPSSDKVNSTPLFTPSWSSGVPTNSQPTLGFFNSEKKISLESKSGEVKVFPEKPLFTPPSTASSFTNSWSSGLFSSSQTPVFSGFQNTMPANTNVADDNEDEEEEQPSSPSVKKSEEKGITTVHEVKCKLYVKSSDPAEKDAWKDRGAGQLSIKCKEGASKGTKDSKPTIVVRNDVGKVVLNALLYPGIKTSTQKNSIVAIFHSADEGGQSDNVVARTFLIRTKTADDRDKLAATIQEYAPPTS